MSTQTHLVKVTYRSQVNGRVAVAYAKIPYGGMVDLAEKMARLLAIQQVRWFRIDAMKPSEIAEHRSELSRWPEALARTIPTTGVNVLA